MSARQRHDLYESVADESFYCDTCGGRHPLREHRACRAGIVLEVTGTNPATPCAICGQPLNPEIPPGMDRSPFTRTVHPQCADQRAAEYVAAGRPWAATS